MSTSGHPRARAWFLSISIDLARARLSFVLWLCLWMVGDELGSIGPAGELTLLLIYRGLDFLLCVRAVRACVRAIWNFFRWLQGRGMIYDARWRKSMDWAALCAWFV
jgi:hypothetical protein